VTRAAGRRQRPRRWVRRPARAGRRSPAAGPRAGNRPGELAAGLADSDGWSKPGHRGRLGDRERARLRGRSSAQRGRPCQGRLGLEPCVLTRPRASMGVNGRYRTPPVTTPGRVIRSARRCSQARWTSTLGASCSMARGAGSAPWPRRAAPAPPAQPAPTTPESGASVHPPPCRKSGRSRPTRRGSSTGSSRVNAWVLVSSRLDRERWLRSSRLLRLRHRMALSHPQRRRRSSIDLEERLAAACARASATLETARDVSAQARAVRRGVVAVLSRVAESLQRRPTPPTGG